MCLPPRGLSHKKVKIKFYFDRKEKIDLRVMDLDSLEDRSLLSATENLRSLDELFEFFASNETINGIARNSKGNFWPSILSRFGLQDQLLSRLDMKDRLYVLAKSLKEGITYNLQIKVNMGSGEIVERVRAVDDPRDGHVDSDDEGEDLDNFYHSFVLKGELPHPGTKMVLQSIQNNITNEQFKGVCFAESYEEMSESLLAMTAKVFREDATNTLILTPDADFDEYGDGEKAGYYGDLKFIEGKDLDGLRTTLAEIETPEEDTFKSMEFDILYDKRDSNSEFECDSEWECDQDIHFHDNFIIDRIFDTVKY